MERPAITGDPRFFRSAGPFSLAAVVEAAEGEAPPRRLMLAGVAPLQTAQPDQVSFLDNRKYLPALQATAAAAIIVHPDLEARVPEGAVGILSNEPYAAWARVCALFHPLPPVTPGIHPSAIVSPDASVHPSAQIGPLTVIEAGAMIGPNSWVGPLATIAEGVVLGCDCRVGSHASLSHALIGDRVVIYPGVRIGQDGFGFALTHEGYLSVPQLGRVILEDDVHVGANTTIDRGSLHDTVIGAGSRLDNLVQIGHNVRLGRGCVIVAQAGISGSTTLEDHVMLGGQAGLTGHIRIGRQARIAAKAGVIADVPAGAEFGGAPAMPIKQFFREHVALRRVAQREIESQRGKGKPSGAPQASHEATEATSNNNGRKPGQDTG